MIIVTVIAFISQQINFSILKQLCYTIFVHSDKTRAATAGCTMIIIKLHHNYSSRQQFTLVNLRMMVLQHKALEQHVEIM